MGAPLDCPADRPHHHNPQTLLLSSAGGEVASRAEEHSASQGIRHRGGVKGNRVPGPQHTTPLSTPPTMERHPRPQSPTNRDRREQVGAGQQGREAGVAK
ncbi:hypothetical protein Pcinc_038507 [Petrolisthes cinctipes]|uniref:Uncharacterized protein n=1 Tax=Petrolisthes cinctipes TaxID=88211 RepID=A0AAE1EK89_PETCI|nr:hypothetical protein Pcinc_038507 [Petrolisthes cinctipes]